MVIGQGYRQESLVCDSQQARDALIAQFRVGRATPFPAGCAYKTITFAPRSRVAGTTVNMPGQRRLGDGRIVPSSVPGEFMSAWQYDGTPESVYIFYPTERMRIVDANGREPSAMNASFSPGASLNRSSSSSGGLWAPDGVGVQAYPAVDRQEVPAVPVVESEISI